MVGSSQEEKLQMEGTRIGRPGGWRRGPGDALEAIVALQWTGP